MDEIAFTPEIHFTPEEPIKFEPELPPLNPDLAPATSPEELAAKNFYGAKRTGVPLSEGKAQGFGEMISRPLVNVARSVTPQQFADAVDSLAVSGAQAEGVIDPEEAQAMLAEPSRKPRKIEAFLAGAQQAAASSVNFFTSPLGVATLGTVGAPAAIQRSIAAAFTADMARQSPQFVRELSTAIKEGDPEKIGRSLTGMGLNVALIKEGLKSVFRPAAIESAPVDNISSSDAVEGKMVDTQPTPTAEAPPAQESAPTAPAPTAAPVDFTPEPAVEAAAGPSGHPFPTSLPAAPGSPETPVRASEIIKDMADMMDRPIRIGHISGKPAGIFKSPEEVARIRVANDIPVAAHEMAHGLERVQRRALGDISRQAWVGAMPPTVRADFKALDYDPQKQRVYEGFAEFVRHWLTLNDTATVAPNAHAWFETTFLRHNPELAIGMNGLRDKVVQFQQQGAVKRVESMIAFDGPPKDATLMQRAAVARDKLMNWFVDDLRPLEQVEREVGGGEMQKGEASPTNLARIATQSSGARAREWANDSMTDFAGNVTGPGLKEIFSREGIRGDEKNATLYAVANRAVELHGRGINPGISNEDALFTLDSLRTPERERFASEIRAWNEGALKYLADAGGITSDASNRISALNQAYIPFFRVFEHGGGLSVGGRRIGDTPNAVKGIKGSGREIRNPLESMIEHANQIIATADKVRIARALVDLTESRKGYGKYVEEIPPDKVPSQFNLDRVRQQLKDAGIQVPDDIDTVLTIWKNAPRNPKGANIVSFVRDGKPHYYELHPDLYRAIQSLDFQRIHPLLDTLFGKPARVIRFGATGIRAGFTLLTNPIKDFPTMLYQTGGNPVRAAVLWGKHLAKQVGMRDSEIKNLWKASGGEISQPLGLDRSVLKSAADEVLANSAGRIAWNIVTHPFETARRILSFTEAAPRLAEFEMTLREMGWRPGMRVTPDMAVEAAIRAAEVTVNFKRGGTYGRMWNQATAFFNPSVQGLSKFTRSHDRQNIRRSVARGVSLMTFPALANWWINKDDAEWKRLPPWVKYGFLNFKIGSEWMRFPMPFEWWYTYGAIPIAMMESIDEHSPLRLRLAMKEALDTLSPPLLPSVAVPPLEIAMNKSFYTGKTLVSDAQNRLLPEAQALPSTTATARKIAEILSVGGVEVSPIKVDHMLAGESGGLLRDIITTSERMGNISPQREAMEPADFPIAGRLFIRDNQSAVIDEFYTELEHVRQKQATWKKLTIEGDPRAKKYELTDSEAEVYASGSKIERVLSKLREEYRDTASRTERRKLFDEMEELAKEAISR